MSTEPSHVKKVLDAVRAAIEKRASKTQLQQTVDGVSVQYMTPEQLRDTEAYYSRKYRKEEARKAGKSSRRTIGPRFRN